MKKYLLITIVGIFGMGSLASLAHHSGTMFDRDKEVTITGIVKEFQYTNPHSWLIIEVTNEDGSVVHVGPGQSCLLREGWTGLFHTVEATRKCFVTVKD